MVVDILRLEGSHEDGSFGKMRIDKQVFADTLEPYQRANKRFLSLFPAGQYLCKRVHSPKFGETFEIYFIEDRDNIVFHWGNFDENTEGCVILGNGIGVIGDRRAILNSKNTFKKFMRALDHVDEFVLTVTDCY